MKVSKGLLDKIGKEYRWLLTPQGKSWTKAVIAKNIAEIIIAEYETDYDFAPLWRVFEEARG